MYIKNMIFLIVLIFYIFDILIFSKISFYFPILLGCEKQRENIRHRFFPTGLLCSREQGQNPPTSSFISETIQVIALITIEDESDLVYDVSNGAISNDLE